MANLVIRNNSATGTESSINLKANNVDWKISGDKDNLKILKNDTQIAEISASGFDTTLTQEDQAAEAKAVGDKITALENNSNTLSNAVDTINDKLNTIDSGANNYVLPAASTSAIGGVRIGYSASGKNYAIQLDSNNKMYVNVPWTDTNYVSSAASPLAINSSKQISIGNWDLGTWS